MEGLLTHPLVTYFITFVESHPVLWFCLLLAALLLLGVNWLADFIPALEILRSKIYLPISRYLQWKSIHKAAIQSDVRGHVNRELTKFRKYLPAGWCGDMDVEWVRHQDLSHTIADGRMIVRVRPTKCQATNFVVLCNAYLRSSFFPKTEKIIPKSHREASVLFIGLKIAMNRGGEVQTMFEDKVLEPAIQRHKQIPKHLEDYRVLDKRGMFTSKFLRELQLTANDARFTSARHNLLQEVQGILDHGKSFIAAYDEKRTGGEDIPPTLWHREGAISKYAVVLVAKPVKVSAGVDPYVNRVRDAFARGARRVYVFGADGERKFADSVVTVAENLLDDIRLVERFETEYDYRGNPSGCGALFAVD